MNLLCLLFAAGGPVLPIAVTGGPTFLGAAWMFDRFHIPQSRDLARILFVSAATAQYMVYGLLLTSRYPRRTPILLLALLLHRASVLIVYLAGLY